MTREEQIIEASQLYAKAQQKPFIDGARWADEHPDFYSVTRKAVKRALKNLWHDAQRDFLPEIDKEVIVLLGNGKVCFGHRPVESFTGISIANHSEMEEYYPERYDKGGWNIPDVKWWLDAELPNMEDEQ